MSSGFVLAAGLGTGLVAYYGGLPTLASARSTGPDELKFVPEGAAVVAYANVRDVMSSEFRQKLRTILPADDTKGQEEFQRETGINIEQDIDYVLAWMTPTPATAGEGVRPVGMVLLRGRFDQARLEALTTQHGGLVETLDGIKVLRPDAAKDTEARATVEVEKDGNGVPTVAKRLHQHDARPMVAFLEPGLVALGEEPTIRAAIAHQKTGGRSILDNQSITQLIGDLEGSSNVWAVGRMDALTAKANLPEALAQHLPAVKWFSASSHVGAGISGLLRAEARDEESAKNLRDVLQGFMGLAKLHAGTKPEFAPVMQSLQISGEGTTVALSFEVPPALVDTLVQLKNAN